MSYESGQGSDRYTRIQIGQFVEGFDSQLKAARFLANHLSADELKQVINHYQGELAKLLTIAGREQGVLRQDQAIVPPQ